MYYLCGQMKKKHLSSGNDAINESLISAYTKGLYAFVGNSFYVGVAPFSIYFFVHNNNQYRSLTY